MQLLSEVLGALGAGALLLVVARRLGARSRHAFGAVALVPVAVAGVLAVPALRDAGSSMLDQRKENAPLSTEEKQLKGGTKVGVNVAFLSWAKAHLPDGDTFHLEISADPEEPRVEGVGARQATILQWSLFQLGPDLAFEQSAKAHDLEPGEGRHADWIVFYEMEPAEYPVPLGKTFEYAPNFVVARSRLAR